MAAAAAANRPENKAPVFSVRCENCQTTFAAQTRQCVHCGAALGGRRRVVFAPPDLTGGGSASGEDSAGEGAPQKGRTLVWIASALAAAGLSMLQRCVN